jgi:hypothetical protein
LIVMGVETKGSHRIEAFSQRGIFRQTGRTSRETLTQMRNPCAARGSKFEQRAMPLRTGTGVRGLDERGEPMDVVPGEQAAEGLSTGALVHGFPR